MPANRATQNEFPDPKSMSREANWFLILRLNHPLSDKENSWCNLSINFLLILSAPSRCSLSTLALVARLLSSDAFLPPQQHTIFRKYLHVLSINEHKHIASWKLKLFMTGISTPSPAPLSLLSKSEKKNIQDATRRWRFRFWHSSTACCQVNHLQIMTRKSSPLSR